MSKGEEINDQAYYTECPRSWAEFGDWLEFADANNLVGYGNVEERENRIEWQTYVTPAYFRQFAELVEYAYGDFSYSGNPRGCVEIGTGFDEDGRLVSLVAREHNSDDENAVILATRVIPEEREEHE